MSLADVPLRFSAAPDAEWLYDCHAQQFARVEHGACMASGFVPLYLSQLFGIPIRQWPEAMARVKRELARLEDEPARAALLAEHRPAKPPAIAAEMALLTYPSAERYVVRAKGHLAPFQLRERFLMQPNVPLGVLQARHAGRWVNVLEEHPLDAPAGRRALRDTLWKASSADARSSTPAPGCYVIGHSGLLVRGRRAGLAIDPVPLSPVTTGSGGYLPEMLRKVSDAVALTHGHFDHYHVPSLLCFADRPILVPDVPRASIVCEDLADRLESFGLDEVRPTPWGAVVEIGDLRVHALPFVGEQFLTSECHPEARNWGNCYVVESDEMRVLVAVDGGFEPDRSIFDVVESWVREHGSIDVVAAQAIGLHAAFGQGDPDLQITALACAHRATEAFELLRPERRVTLAPADIPKLVEVCGAGTVVLYGQFQFEPGRPAVHDELMDAVRRELRSAGASGVAVPALRIGEGIAAHSGAARMLFE